jgi:hypothetical protein
MEKAKTAEITRRSSSEDLTFLCTTALHSLPLPLLCSGFGLPGGGSGAMKVSRCKLSFRYKQKVRSASHGTRC